MKKPEICLVGDILVDVSLKTQNTSLKLRFGGIVHSARCLWALNIPFSLAYFAPAYLDNQISDYLTSLGCVELIKLGNVTGSPYVFLVEEVKEVGNQGYDFLLREDIKIEYNEERLNYLMQNDYSDYIVISGNFDLHAVFKHIHGNIHLDVANNISSLQEILSLNKKLTTLFLSTSSDLFRNHYQNDLKKDFNVNCDYLILKENRGGSRGLSLLEDEIISIGAQTRPITHSVGVGDVYNVVFVSQYHSTTVKNSMTLASWIAAEYAMTTFPDDFKRNVDRVIKSEIEDLIKLQGVSLPWEERSSINIYIAAPDFNFVDVKPIDLLFNSLKYHNFAPRRPVIENGQMEDNASKKRRQELFTKDMQLLNDCSILIAVLLYDDPGTLIEIGLAAAKGIPTIVYDPYGKANNCMLTELPLLVSSDLDEIISEVFVQSVKL
ncbi:nucleoside 2-deoxyribosyltransferase [Flavobacterium lindanitolerans]|uniref:nucleoside 2-deoxyribosyltransferase n=1 Tax=Flavobacterium lindanitolerans TaxID=428988 RepID=UPI001A5A822C|nr:nucleoside 2-deoxyribosyltransferase [Flavobacterium lindanitolerans]MBL7866768.1 nucleoside 2-deoxyribosyltransferase [Flavobacterium lindanitolerans]MDQ7959565.1 nucleoside 2-deoxyribosyltransferase [Flavobacterium lindanitolerans]